MNVHAGALHCQTKIISMKAHCLCYKIFFYGFLIFFWCFDGSYNLSCIELRTSFETRTPKHRLCFYIDKHAFGRTGQEQF